MIFHSKCLNDNKSFTVAMIYFQLVLKESEHKYRSIHFFRASLALNEELRKCMIVLGFDKRKNRCTLQLAHIHEK